ncbi:MBL fold metallo-hydrolase [Porphyromonas circumdentaria]|uniref:Phosphoribosyl 1,2-cyclic phosphodiesterase n=1 Tax=Porphyromonas circumdentaria TaxID=29524 RepID=A0A1T4M8L6_9PORP|nr:MBL fold metallo-hydrolase [Porphyromonas circumdentaria]MBB6275527.1 phosphoribosyl 1,2-cyclic phosphodiesterase [Porphyromonas circumdentaria]MDO4722177.1 MBL fold metallo-hydrolase [Porphyromonas circumdentaria]SJZ63044.1 Phosphoribosyl 1,2-cyclic phosphodiesterase [Porphyromonas circumdentaria]
MASGSSGNCYYLGCDDGGIIIDAGVSLRSLTKTLSTEGIALAGHVMGVLLTHEHADHIKGLGKLLKAHHLPVFASEPTLDAIRNSSYHGYMLDGAKQITIEQFTPFTVAGFTIEPFCVPHDSACNMGYHIYRGEFAFTLITDAGHITEAMYHYARKAKYLVLEANYDPTMLRLGRYSAILKARVAGPRGHLSNIESAQMLQTVYHDEMQHVWLCHLSHENNHPELCYKTFEQELLAAGISLEQDLNLETLRRTTPSRLYLLPE